MKANYASIIKKLLCITIGAIFIAVSYNIFIIPFGLLSGGVAGFALTANYIFGIPVQWGILLLNLPLFMWGLKVLQRKTFVSYSIYGMFILFLAIPLVGDIITVPQVDIFLASIFSGVLSGIGAGISFRCGSTFGGTDIISLVLKRKKNLSVGSVSFGFNIIVIAISLYFFPLKIALYTTISMFVASRIVNLVIDGLSHHKSVMIITDKTEEVADRIMNELQRGITYLDGEGGYSRSRKKVINCIVTHFEIAQIKEIISEVDPDSFMFVTETVEVKGRGFPYSSLEK